MLLFGMLENPIITLAFSGLITEKLEVGIAVTRNIKPKIINLWFKGKDTIPLVVWKAASDKLITRWYGEAVTGMWEQDNTIPSIEYKGNDSNVAVFNIVP